MSSEAAWLAALDSDNPLDNVLAPVCLRGVELPLRASLSDDRDSISRQALTALLCRVTKRFY